MNSRLFYIDANGNIVDYLRFARYIREYLLPALDVNDVIVMDNASYHSVLVEKIPTKSSKKDAMKE